MAEGIPDPQRCSPGGIVALARLIEAHEGAFEYDWRARFRLSLRVIGRSMSYGEALRLTERLSLDPSSAISAALSGWDYPLSREALALVDLYDLQHTSKARRRPARYPRPWSDDVRRVTGKTSLTPAALRRVLDRTRGVTS